MLCHGESVMIRHAFVWVFDSECGSGSELIVIEVHLIYMLNHL
jgi:hypothetical protein